jgi:hypothetical protein
MITDETTYREEVKDLAMSCQDNKLSFKVYSTHVTNKI